MKFIKENLPWVASTAALVLVGMEYFERSDSAVPAVAQAAPTQQIIRPESALDAISASQPIAPPTTAAELSAIIAEVTQQQVTRAAPLQTSIAPVPEGLEVVVPAIAEDPTAFFTSATAKLSADDFCGDDLRALASEARIYFPNGGVSPADSGLVQARLLGAVLTDCPGYILEVEGHSDPLGDPQAALEISRQRAEAVVARIAALGIDTSKFVAVGYGDQQPANLRGTEAPAFYDRRVEFTVVAQDQTQPPE